MLDYHVDSARKIVITRARGRVTVHDLATHLVRMMGDPSFHPELNALIIAEDVGAVPNLQGVGMLAPLVRAWSKRRQGVKWAFVLPDRATRDFAESALGQVSLSVVSTRCFLSESSAVSWLESTSGSGTTPPRAETAERVV